jgi:hypothetical protein
MSQNFQPGMPTLSRFVPGVGGRYTLLQFSSAPRIAWG